MQKINLLGRRFGTVIIISEAAPKKGCTMWEVLCDCGKLFQVHASNIIRRRAFSCADCRATQGGMSKSTIYYSWKDMRRRCLNPKHTAWERYGGRGIQCCAKWLTFAGFLEDMGPSYRPGLEIDRMDTDGHYCKENCKWSTPKEQGNNRRNNHLITAFGKTQTISQWVEETGLQKSTIQKRITKYKMAADVALTRRVA